MRESEWVRGVSEWVRNWVCVRERERERLSDIYIYIHTPVLLYKFIKEGWNFNGSFWNVFFTLIEEKEREKERERERERERE